MMHVAMASPWPPWRKGGGTELHTHELSSALVALGHRVTVLTLDIPGREPAPYGVGTVDGPFLKLLRAMYDRFTFGTAVLRQLHDWGFNRKVGRAARRLGADVLHRQGVGAVAFRSSLPLVLTLHNGSTPHDEAPAGAGRGLRWRLGDWDRRRRIRGMRRCILGATEVVCVSEHVRQRVVRRVGAERASHVIANGCSTPVAPLPRRKARASLGIAADQPLVLFVGRLSKEKRPLRLLPLLEDPACHLAYVGGGKMEADLRRAAASNPRLRVLGFLGEEEKMRWMRGADVLALPSGNFEGNPIVMMEALRQGTAVYGTDPDWLPEGLRRFGRFGDDVQLALEAARIDASPAEALVPSWDDVAKATAEVYRRAVAAGRSAAGRAGG
jgi:glycosyltransferase involved in cell wall biosynthesis